MAETIIEIEQLTKVFYTDEIETHALSGVHMQIERGEYVAMSGPSGCGKSTLLSIIGLLDTPTAGRYKLNGKEVANLDFADRSRIRNQEIGFIFQSFNLIGDLSVAENVELPLTYRTGMPAAERKKRVQESLERVNMAHRMRHYPAQLSGGQQQRVAVARALAGSPSILLADEPTGNLDSKNGAGAFARLSRWSRCCPSRNASRMSSRAVSSSVLRWPAHSSSVHQSCFWMSPWGPSIASSVSKCRSSSSFCSANSALPSCS